jgi:hypothetical protein
LGGVILVLGGAIGILGVALPILGGAIPILGGAIAMLGGAIHILGGAIGILGIALPILASAIPTLGGATLSWNLFSIYKKVIAFLLFATPHLTWYIQTHHEISIFSDHDIPGLPTSVTSIRKCCCIAWCAV